MVITAFDESHSETWTIDINKANFIDDTSPEYNYYGHLIDLINSALGGSVRRITDKWDNTTLKDVDILIIPHPADSIIEPGCGGSPIFTETDINKVIEFVENGGGLFVLGEYEISRWGSNINDLLVQFGMTFNEDVLRNIRGAGNSHLVARHFQCHRIEEQAATDGVKSISYHRGCSINTTGQAIPLIFAPQGQAVFAVSTYGKGKIAVIGDSDLFSIPFIGHCDNARLFTKTIQWLARENSVAPQKMNSQPWKIIREKNYDLSPVDHLQNVGNITGKHLVDCSRYRTELQTLFESVSKNLPSPYENLEEFLLQAELAFHELPKDLRRSVIEFKREGNKYGGLLLKSLPIDKALPVTPADSKKSLNKKTFESEFWIASIAGGIGDPINYSQEKDGEIFQNICPTPHNAAALSSESSIIDLDFHTETAFHPFLPDFVMLLCLRPDHERVAKTFFASTRHMIPFLPLKYRAVLFEDQFRSGIDFSFGSESGLQGNGPIMAVFHGDPYDPFMKYDLDLMKGLNENAEEALRQMKLAANKAKNYVYLNTGDLLIIDNRRSVHGRSFFKPRYDGMDRWLQRVYVVRDLAHSEEDRVRQERIIETEFIL